MERVAVVGCGGAGKSTFARALGARLGLPVVHLDHVYWQPGWTATPNDEFARRQAALLDGLPRWVVDGNYSGTVDVRLERADTVVNLALPRWRCLLGAIGRSIRTHGHDAQAFGCPERLDLAFYRYIWRYERDARPRLDARLAPHRHRLRIIELRSRADVRRALAEVSALA